MKTPPKMIVTTYTGYQLNVFDPDPNDIDIVDIAVGLSRCCRFGGQPKFFYSVAQHSINGSLFINEHEKLPFLLHDATEAYMGDIVRNIKEHLRDYKLIEGILSKAIFSKFGVVLYDKLEIKRMDNVMMAAEAEVLMTNTGQWYFPEEPIKADIIEENMNTVKNRYLNLFWKYSSNQNS